MTTAACRLTSGTIGKGPRERALRLQGEGSSVHIGLRDSAAAARSAWSSSLHHVKCCHPTATPAPLQVALDHPSQGAMMPIELFTHPRPRIGRRIFASKPASLMSHSNGTPTFALPGPGHAGHGKIQPQSWPRISATSAHAVWGRGSLRDTSPRSQSSNCRHHSHLDSHSTVCGAWPRPSLQVNFSHRQIAQFMERVM